nr:FG-GAP repeat protein [Saprospiraceae bacterium]
GNVGSNDFTGSVHTYTFDGNFWVPDQVVLANDGNFEDWFGFSISLFEDKMVIGAALDDVGAPYGGSAYFFELINNTWTFHSKMADDTPVFSGGFGTSVSLTDNYAAIGDFHNNIHFVEFKNDQWIRKSKKLISQLSTVSISNEYSITSGGVLLKSTGNQWYQYEKANDPQDISNGAIFKTVAIDQITFVMCAPTALNNSGLAIFGKIK